jgi:hypothetical protein
MRASEQTTKDFCIHTQFASLISGREKEKWKNEKQQQQQQPRQRSNFI